MTEPTYHLWLAPVGETHARLAGVMSALAVKLGAPIFAPHVTLLADLGDTEVEHLERCEALATALPPTSITLSQPSHTAEYFRCLFMQVDATPEVMRLRRRTAAAFARDALPYMPHLSLLYGSFSSALKDSLVRDLPCTVRTSFVADAIYLIRADSTAPKDWHTIGRFPFIAPLR